MFAGKCAPAATSFPSRSRKAAGQPAVACTRPSIPWARRTAMFALLPLLALTPRAFAGPIIQDVNTDLSHYAPGSSITIYVDLDNTSGSSQSGHVAINITHLGVLTTALAAQPFSLASNGTTTLVYSWTAPATDYTGYSVEVNATNSSGGSLDSMNSAIDVSSNWTKFPRYGYVADYPSNIDSTSATHGMWLLKNYHIDGVQFYDWQWKHHVPLAGTVSSPSPSWENINGTTNYASAIDDYINGAHYYGISAMNYNLMYGAFAGYGQDGSGVNYQWGLWTQNNGTNQWNISMPQGWATSNIYIFDPGNTGWQSYIYQQEKNVFSAYNFDGWHVDQLGNWNTMYNYSGSSVNYGAEFPGFLSGAASATGKTVVFNAVAGFGLPGVLPDEAFAYVECWPNANGGTQNNYNDLKSVVDSINSASPGKGVVLPAYMDEVYAENNTGNFNTPGVLLADAAIFAMGASHLELGTGDNGSATLNMLDNAYFPNENLTPTTSLLSTLQVYYDFDVEYENLLRGQLANSSNQIAIAGLSSGPIAANYEVWAFAKNTGSSHLLNFINLLNAGNTNWRDDNANYPVPPTQSNVAVTYYYGSGAAPAHVYWASPDTNNGRMTPLSFTTGSNGSGNYIQFTMPSLAYWDMVYLTN
jgi:dextranase